MGGGGKGGGGGHTPYEAPNTLESAQKIKIIDLLCEGVVGSDVTFKNIYLDNTPIQNDDGSYNFTGIKVSALPGTHNQDYLAGFDTTDKIVSVGAEVKQDTPITRTITDPLIDSVRVTLALGSLVTMKDNGDRVGGAVSLTVMCGDKSYPVTISGKTTSAYHQDVVLTELPDTPFNISVHRNTADSTTDKVSNKTHWVSYVESIHAKFSYPHSVVVGLEIDSAQFGGKIPTRTYKNQWTQLKVPANYDPITRTYDGIWNGEFKTAWSNNPAWVFYDIVTDKRYGFGERLEGFGSDKWWLYQIAKYCDQMVPDGFGGTEPRFTCNAYLSSPRNAKSVLDDLASVFRGIAVWDGQKVIALQDAKKDPVATYTNSNVEKDGFVYSGSAKKTIFTAVHVKYIDSQTAKTQTEYVSNDDAIKRFGLNVKQITAFACTSRGQAARFGKWLIETSIREGQMVSFTVGREGIRHLPFDIIEIADNDYAGDLIGGRVLAVSGNIITVDSPITDIDSIRYYVNGQSKVVDVESIDGTTITLAETPDGIEQLSVFSATKTDVKPRLFRALGIKENSGGTYTISAVTHDEDKESIVDDGVTFERENFATKHLPHINYGNVSKDGDELLIAWDGTNTSQYLIKIYKDDQLFKSYTQDTPEIRLKGLSNGDYKAEIRGKSANGQLTEPVIKEWSISYDITGLKATAELFAIKLDWTNPTTVINKAKIEIYRSKTTFRSSATKVATLPYPTDTFTQNGIKLNETHYFWLRIVDEQGNTGEWISISGQCNDDASEIVKSISGQITETELAQSLIDSLQADIDNAKSDAISTASADAAAKVLSEAKVRASAIEAEANQRTLAIKAESAKQTKALTDKATELGTQISAVETVNDTQAQQISTLTAKDDELLSAIENEKQARAAGDTAEAQQRLALTARVNTNKSDITTLTKTVSDNDQSTAEQLDTLTSTVETNRVSAELAKASVSGNVLHVAAPANAAMALGGIKVGAIKIRLPQYRTRTMMKFKIEVFNYNENTSMTYDIAGYNYSSRWFRCTATATGASAATHKVRFGHDGDKDCIWIGESDTAWSSLKIKVVDFIAGSANYTVEKWATGWELSLVTAFDTVEVTADTLNPAKGVDAVTAELTTFKQTQTSTNQAQTIVNNQALSRIADAESGITDLQHTKASKTEVATLARTSLKSEWQEDAAAKVGALGETVETNRVSAELAKADVDGNVLHVQYPKGGAFTTPNGTSTGAIKIRLPQYNTATMLKFKVDIYNYATDTSASYDLAGYIYGGGWINCTATATGASDATYKVRFGSDGEKSCIWIGELTSKWSYARIKVSNFIAGYRNYTVEKWATGWELSLVTAFDTVEVTADTLNPAKGVDAVTAELTTFKQTQSTKDAAQTTEINNAKSRIGANEANITSIRQTLVNSNSALASRIDSVTAEINESAVAANINFTTLAEFKNDWVANYPCTNLSITSYPSIYFGSNTNSGDYGWYILKQRFPMTETSAYKITYRVQSESGSGRLYLGAEGYDKNGNMYNTRGAKSHGGQWYAYTSAVNSTWQSIEIYIVGSQVTDYDDLQYVRQVSSSVRHISPLIIANYVNQAGRVKLSNVTVQSVTQNELKATAMHTIKTQAVAGNKRAIAGITMGASTNGDDVESQVIVMADKFGVVKNASDGTVKPMFSVVNNQVAVNGDLFADGTILGNHIKANQTLTAPKIIGGELNINNKFIVDKYGNMNAKSGSFEGTVKAENIKGDVANIAEASVGTLQIAGQAVTIPKSAFNDATVQLNTGNWTKLQSLVLPTNLGFTSIVFNANIKLVGRHDSPGSASEHYLQVRINGQILEDNVLLFEDYVGSEKRKAYSAVYSRHVNQSNSAQTIEIYLKALHNGYVTSYASNIYLQAVTMRR